MLMLVVWKLLRGVLMLWLQFVLATIPVSELLDLGASPTSKVWLISYLFLKPIL